MFVMAKTPGKRIGRPPEPVPQDQADAIVEWLYDGRSLMSYCAQAKISLRAVYQWIDKDDAFRTRFTRARSSGADSRFERAGEILRDAKPENWQLAKLQAEHEYKAAACYAPGTYGAKALAMPTVEESRPDPDPRFE